MPNSPSQTVCWTPVWNKQREGIGVEHLLLGDRVADSVVLAFDEEHGPFRLTYHLTWDSSWRSTMPNWPLPEKTFPVAQPSIRRSRPVEPRRRPSH